ncbi:MAG: AAA family ATPase [Actinobacteria bacterium]|nr:AAA family ATPase [Actinomycetota bacterium]
MSHQGVLLTGDLDITQWRAEAMQLVNWGGFHGFERIEFSPESTLVAGATGSGKSTILDAYLALMMDSNTPFNGASNDATIGRARSKEQRNLLTYLRGKLDDTTADGEDTARVLRGATKATWGAIAVTFIDRSANRFTAARIYHVARNANSDTDITKRLCTIEGTIDLRDLADLTETLFAKRALEARYRNLSVHSTYTQFAATVQTRLCIGTHGDGSNALRLLARIQAGKAMPTVDALFKTMVLETPPTFAAADAAAAHFVDLEDSYEQMVTAQQKRGTLEGITENWKLRKTQLEAIAAIDALHLDAADQSPFLHWAAATETRLVAEAVAANQDGLERANDDHEKLATQANRLRERHGELERAHRDAGGGAIEDIDRKLEHLRGALDTARTARGTFDARTAVLELQVSSEADLRAAKAAAETFLATGYTAATKTLEAERGAVDREVLWPAQNQRAALLREQQSLQGRSGRVPEVLHNARVEAAAALGVDPSELPFVAELIDLADGQREWRDAAELALSAMTRIMLVDDRLLDTLTVRIDRLDWRTRINYQGVELRDLPPAALDPDMLSGKLLYADDSPFTWWVQERLTRSDTDALCVSRPEDLDGQGRRVTRSGQLRQGRRGAHGRNNQPPIIGFDSASRIAEIETELSGLNATIKGAERHITEIEGRGQRLTALRDAHYDVANTRWATIDVGSPERQIDELTEQRERILDSDNQLAELSRQLESITSELKEADRDEILAEARVNHLKGTIQELEDRSEQLSREMERLAATGYAHTEDQAELLDDILPRDEAGYDATRFATQLAATSRELKARRDAADERIRAVEQQLTRTFRTYQERWPDPNLGVDIASYPDYAEILDGITASGLDSKRVEWAHRVTSWTGEDLVPLHLAFDEAVEEIKERLAPVNDILDSLAFGAHGDRLHIELRHIHRDDQARFRKQLKELSSGVLSNVAFDAVEARFKQLRAFIEQIRPDSSIKGHNRDDYLNVHRHLELSAVALDGEGNVRAKYTSLGGKSGGETQELAAFIVGAALRYQLGDETRSVPRFAPVFLDEGFVKADAQFAGRSVKAWRGLGFQLIVATALGTVSALEPHMDEILVVTKNPDTGRARVQAMADRDRP